MAPNMDVVFALVALVIGFFFVVWLLDHLVDWLKMRRLLKHPEYVKAKAEAEARAEALRQRQRFIPPTLIPRKVNVIVVRESQLLQDVCSYDGESIRCRGIGMMFTAPTDYTPYTSLHRGKKIGITFIFNDKGNALKLSSDGKLSEIAPDPRISEIVIGKRLLTQVFRGFWGLDYSSLMAGLGLGVFAVVLIVFFILPILGYPVTIGRIPVEVRITQPQTSTLPPPGNYTIPIR